MNYDDELARTRIPEYIAKYRGPRATFAEGAVWMARCFEDHFRRRAKGISDSDEFAGIVLAECDAEVFAEDAKRLLADCIAHGDDEHVRAKVNALGDVFHDRGWKPVAGHRGSVSVDPSTVIPPAPSEGIQP